MLLAAVAEHLSGGELYPLLAQEYVLEPLGIELGSFSQVRCGEEGGEGAREGRGWKGWNRRRGGGCRVMCMRCVS